MCAPNISRVADVVVDGITAWQCRPVDAVYPILYIDAIRIEVREAGVVANKAVRQGLGGTAEPLHRPVGLRKWAVGVDRDGLAGGVDLACVLPVAAHGGVMQPLWPRVTFRLR